MIAHFHYIYIGEFVLVKALISTGFGCSYAQVTQWKGEYDGDIE